MRRPVLFGPPRCHGGPMMLVGAGFESGYPYLVYMCQVCGEVVVRWPEGKPPWRW